MKIILSKKEKIVIGIMGLVIALVVLVLGIKIACYYDALNQYHYCLANANSVWMQVCEKTKPDPVISVVWP